MKPYVKRGKNDASDAEALFEAMSRPTMRCVPTKTEEQQAALMLVTVRDRLSASGPEAAQGATSVCMAGFGKQNLTWNNLLL